MNTFPVQVGGRDKLAGAAVFVCVLGAPGKSVASSSGDRESQATTNKPGNVQL